VARPVRLPPAAERQLLARTGTRAPDPKPRTVRVPKAEHARGLDTQCKQQKLPVGVPEFIFHPTRRWRYDRAWPAHRLVVDIDGGAWLHRHGKTAHSHGQGAGFERDRKKDAEAMLLGFRVLRVTTKMVQSGAAIEYLRHLLTSPYSARSVTQGFGGPFRVRGGPLRGEQIMGWHIVDDKGFTVGVSCDDTFLRRVGIDIAR
jgi:hypothetical protein